MTGKAPILQLDSIKTHFTLNRGLFTKKETVKAVDGVSLSLDYGETLGIVGESGCGKSTLGRTIVKMYEPVSGRMFFEGEDETHIRGEALKQYREKVQLIFQDPYASLDPRMTVGEIIKEPMETHNLYGNNAGREEKAVELLKTVGLKPDHIRRYPHEFSGGQRQRISIARTLAMEPRLIICDEPISALDVSIQAQIVNLLDQIQKDTGVSYLFIAHDLTMVRHISDRIAVMYLGHIMEIGDARDVFFRPVHPYSKALISAIPISDPVEGKKRERVHLQGEIPSPVNPPKGCPFSTRCPYADGQCKTELPPLRTVEGREVACFKAPRL